MAKFQIGQLARVRWSDHFPEYVGKVCRILSEEQRFYCSEGDYFYFGYEVDLDPSFGPRADSLEPIVDDGRQVVSWSECLWQPEGVAA